MTAAIAKITNCTTRVRREADSPRGGGTGLRRARTGLPAPAAGSIDSVFGAAMPGMLK
jgi:hypothetical protein